MKKVLFTFGIIIIISACKNNNSPEHADVPEKVKMQDESTIKLTEGQLFSSIDTVCGMTVGNEPADTLSVDGKLLGFCSTGCKESFMADNNLK